MPSRKTSAGRRSFLKSVALGGGGLVLGFNWLTSCTDKTEAEILA
ncbi:MAG: twin-arginine translocation signal domain-containing protein, partial [Bacteroidota bacterium]